MGFAKDLQPASYRGVPFLVASESVSRGKKTAVHEYPNTDVRFTEELGKLPPTFQIEAIVHGDDALNQRFRLENALEKNGRGLLIHPIYGRLEVVTLEFSVSSNQTSLGQYSFQISFSKSRANITPTPSASTSSKVSSAAKILRGTLNKKIEDIYKTPTTQFNYESVRDTLLNSLGAARSRINSTVGLSSKGSATFNRVYRSITGNISSTIFSASSLRDSITLFYSSALDSSEFTSQLDSAWSRLVDTPIVPPGNADTSKHVEREQNNTLIVEHQRLTSLVNSYEAKAYKDYTTEEDLVKDRSFLDQNYRSFLNGANEDIADAGLASIAEDLEVRNQFADLRVVAKDVFDEKEKTVFRIVDIDPGKSSMALTTFRYYGDLALLDQIIGLNTSVNSANFNKAIKSLSS